MVRDSWIASEYESDVKYTVLKLSSENYTVCEGKRHFYKGFLYLPKMTVYFTAWTYTFRPGPYVFSPDRILYHLIPSRPNSRSKNVIPDNDKTAPPGG